MADKRGDELKLPSYMQKKARGTGSAPVSSAVKKAGAGEKCVQSRSAKKTSSKKKSGGTSAKTKTGGTSRKSAKRKYAGRKKWIAGIFVAVLAIAILLAAKQLEVSAEGTLIVGSVQKMPEGISILGLDVSGMTKNAARTIVSAAADELQQNAAVTLLCDGTQYTIPAGKIGLAYDIESTLQRALKYDPKDAVVNVGEGDPGQINDIFTWDSDLLTGALDEAALQFDREAEEPVPLGTLNEDHTVRFTQQEGKSGRKLNVEATAEKIEVAFRDGNYEAEIQGVVEEIQPKLTQDMLSGSIVLRASYSTRFPTSSSDETVQNRVFNIEKAAGIINECVVLPQEEWSFNDYVGLRSYESGWKGANGIVDGKGYEVQAGGGICQVSSTMYNALLCADVKITDRRAHSIPSTYVAEGLDATVDSTGIDLRFLNDTGAPLYLFTYIEDTESSRYREITFLVYGAPLPNGVTYKTSSTVVEVTDRSGDIVYTDDDTIPRGYKVVQVEHRDGYKVEAYRDKYVNGVYEGSELLYTDTYKGNAEESLRGTASPKYYEPPADAVPIV